MIDWKPIAEKFREADAILIGASNGLSITEGLHLFADNAAFDELFGDFKQKYGLHCILQGMMAGWPSEEKNGPSGPGSSIITAGNTSLRR